MIIKILLTLLAFVLFFIIFVKLIKKNDTSYVYILLLQAIGITVEFLEIVTKNNYNIIITAIMYIFSIIIPIIICILEKKWANLSEVISFIKAKMYEKKGNQDKARNILLKLIDKYPNSY